MTQVRTILHDNFNSLFQSDVDSCTLKRDESNLNRYNCIYGTWIFRRCNEETVDFYALYERFKDISNLTRENTQNGETFEA